MALRLSRAENIGAFQERIVIQSRTATLGEYGDETEAWATANTVWAEVLPQTGREFMAAKQVQADLTHLIRIRYASSTKPTVEQRVYWESRTLQILNVVNVGEENRIVEVWCREMLT